MLSLLSPFKLGEPNALLRIFARLKTFVGTNFSESIDPRGGPAVIRGGERSEAGVRASQTLDGVRAPGQIGLRWGPAVRSGETKAPLREPQGTEARPPRSEALVTLSSPVAVAGRGRRPPPD